MKILIYSSGYENLGLEYISASLKEKGHELFLEFDDSFFYDGMFDNRFLKNIFNHTPKYIADRIVEKSPGLVLFSSMTDRIMSDLNIANIIKKISPKINICFGGIHPTLLPEQVLKHDFVDYVCVGEGEKAVVQLADVLDHKGSSEDIQGIWYKKNDSIVDMGVTECIKDLDMLPFPDKDIFFSQVPEFQFYYRIITGRGCPYNCSFCGNFSLKKILKDYSFRRRSPENVINELKQAKEKYRIRGIIFEDDLFLYDKEWLISFLYMYEKEIHIPFQCTAYPLGISEDILIKLKRAGCRFIEIGVQTLNEDIRRDLFFRMEKNKDIYNSLRLLKESRIMFNVFHITDIPDVKRSEELKALRLYLKYSPTVVHYVRLTYYPKTGIAEYALKKNIISESEYKNICNGLIESYEKVDNRFSDIYNLFGLIGIIPEKILLFFARKRILRKNSVVLFKILPAFFLFLTKRASFSMRIYPYFYFRLVKRYFFK